LVSRKNCLLNATAKKEMDLAYQAYVSSSLNNTVTAEKQWYKRYF
jgi:hypothetical protein